MLLQRDAGLKQAEISSCLDICSGVKGEREGGGGGGVCVCARMCV
jgi:hypothetical protein